MFILCTTCDKVFHKAVNKRSHFRIPNSSYTGAVDPATLRNIIILLPDDLRVVIYGMHDWYHSTHNRGNNYLMSGGVSDKRVEMISVLLGGIRGILDDRRVSIYTICVSYGY